MAVGALGAYSLTRFAFPGRGAIARLILCTYMFAPIMIVIRTYILARRLGIVNTHAALVLSYASFCLPFSLWLLRAFFQSIPLELEEAAHVDGAGRARALLHIVLPLALPGLIATSIFTFTLAWNDYIFTRILIASDELKTLPVAVQDLFAAALVDWGLVMPPGTLITIPALNFVIAVQRQRLAGRGTAGRTGCGCRGHGPAKREVDLGRRPERLHRRALLRLTRLLAGPGGGVSSPPRSAPPRRPVAG